MQHTYACPIRWGDMDAQGHLNNVVFLDYLQEARIDYLNEAGIVAMLDTGVLVASHRIAFHAPVVAGDRPLPITMWLQQIGGSRFEIGYELGDPDDPTLVVATARTVLVPFDLAGGGLRRLAASERVALTPYLEPHEPMPGIEGLPAASDPAHRFALRVRWSDLDPYDHVNNVKFAEYLQQARLQLIADAGFASGDEQWLLARQDLFYLRPLDFRREPYEVRTTVGRVGTRSVVLAVMIIDPADGTTYARGESVVVRTTPWTADERERLAVFAAR